MPNEQNNICPIKIIPMAEWIKKPSSKGNCKPCFLAPVAQWYVDELAGQGHKDKAEELTKFIENHDSEDKVEKICEKLDQVKKEAEEKLRNRLLDFDCEVQIAAEEDLD